MKYKACKAFKASDSDDGAVFEAIVSVFGNVDQVGDVVIPGAFLDSLAEWKAIGDPIPVLWSHRMDDPRFSIGVLDEADELAPGDPRIPEWCDDWVKQHGGLWVKGRLDTGPDATDVAVIARKLLVQRRVTQFSYAYDVVDGGWGEANGSDAYELRKLRLYEVSPTQVGCNELTQLLGAKALELASTTEPDEGASARADLATIARLASSMSEAKVREAIAVLGKVLALRNDGSVTEGRTAKDEEPEGVKSEEPTRFDGEAVRLFLDLKRHELEVVD